MTATELLAAVHADPTNRDRWLILADAYFDAGDEAEERFWRFAASFWLTPHKFIATFTGDVNGWGWMSIRDVDDNVEVWRVMPVREKGDTIRRCFERLRIGWNLAGRPE